MTEDWFSIISLVLEAILSVILVLGNSLVLLSVFRQRKLRTFSNKLISSFSLANVIAGLCILLMDLLNDNLVLKSNTACMVFAGFYQYAICITIHHICIISVDKYCAIQYALRYSTISEGRFKYYMIAGWGPAIPLSFVPIILEGYKTIHVSERCTFSYNGLWILLDLLIFWIPCLIVILAYSMICRAVRRHIRSIQRTHSSMGTELPSAGKSKRYLGLILLSFLGCWCPSFIMEILEVSKFHRKEDTANWVHELTYWLGFCSYVINPFVYAFRNELFRKEALNILLCIFCCNATHKRSSLQKEIRKSWQQENIQRRLTSNCEIRIKTRI